MGQPSLSLYLHIPFCRHRCSYCDFNTYTSLSSLQADYAAALAAEVAQAGELAKAYYGHRPAAHTVFFGGGTPSLMTPAELELILTAVSHNFTLHPAAEISMEANPGTVDEGYLTAVRALGINRLSFGVQSVIPSELALLEREHDFATVIRAVAQARAAGFDNFNLDLIYGVPGQTLASWQESVEAVLTLHPTHFSLYCLTIEPGTPMQRWLENGRFAPPDPDLAAEQYEWAARRLAAAGFDHYEISNWALPGWQCEHNLTYWRNLPYLGLGAGAHGYAAEQRYHIVRQPRVYLRRMAEGQPAAYPLTAAVADSHHLTRAEAMADTVMTQLRLLHEGLDLAAFAKTFGESLQAAFPGEVERLTEWGLVWEKNGRLLLTEQGRFLSNQVFYRFV
ncbi:MAG: radical SAM family heme chaperone HemW [Anaerolineales bacterium]|nr:radical SAM family heme chaperone HemW [Anaerolineales bacterium]